MLMIILGLILVGLALGSFVNAWAWRLHEQEDVKLGKNPDKKYLARLSIQKGRSMCTFCKHELAAIDLVPILSWLYLRGKCRYCHHRIKNDNPMSEILIPVLLVISYVWWPYTLTGVGKYLFSFWIVFVVAFMALAIYDIRWYILPDNIVRPLIILALIQVAGQIAIYGISPHLLSTAFWGVVFSSGIFYSIFVLSKGQWIGGGDVKLAIVIGIILGGPTMSLLMLFIASSLGSIVGIPILLAGNRNVRLPFGPFLLVATFIVMLFGKSIITWYKTKTGIY